VASIIGAPMPLPARCSRQADERPAAREVPLQMPEQTKRQGDGGDDAHLAGIGLAV
jgi:hypothetical protein